MTTVSAYYKVTFMNLKGEIRSLCFEGESENDVHFKAWDWNEQKNEIFRIISIQEEDGS